MSLRIVQTKISDIREHYEAQEGPHLWFSPNAMRFAGTRFVGRARTFEVLAKGGTETVPMVSFFVTADFRAHKEGSSFLVLRRFGSRGYTLRRYDWASKTFSTLSSVGHFDTATQAREVRSLACLHYELERYRQDYPIN
jgi:hypothetical protein